MFLSKPTFENIFSTLIDYNVKILGDGMTTYYDEESNSWEGSLTHIDQTKGYWVMVNQSTWLNVEGTPIDPNLIYELNINVNSVSYPFAGSAPIEETIPE